MLRRLHFWLLSQADSPWYDRAKSALAWATLALMFLGTPWGYLLCLTSGAGLVIATPSFRPRWGLAAIALYGFAGMVLIGVGGVWDQRIGWVGVLGLAAYIITIVFLAWPKPPRKRQLVVKKKRKDFEFIPGVFPGAPA